MGTLFISYRRSDATTVSGRIYDNLARTFGENNVFKDVYAIPPGVNFAQYIDGYIRKCSVLLAIIGSEWLSAVDQNGAPRLDDPNDFVRLEIEQALKRKIPVIPLLIDGAAMPAAKLLPASLHELPLQNALAIRTQTDFDGDMARLSVALSRWVKPVTPLRPLSDDSPGHPILRSSLTFSILIAIAALIVGNLAAAMGTANHTPIWFLVGLFTMFLLLSYFLAGLIAARRTGLPSSGTSAGLLTGIGGAVLGGVIFGIVIGSAPDLYGAVSGGSIITTMAACTGALLLAALVLGAALGTVGGRVGNRQYVRALTRR
jgi:hypothetical protein